MRGRKDARLWHGSQPIDFVYNRLTDFALEQPAQAALKLAYLAREVVVSPHPRTHTLYADKRDLTLICDEAYQTPRLGFGRCHVAPISSGAAASRIDQDAGGVQVRTLPYLGVSATHGVAVHTLIEVNKLGRSSGHDRENTEMCMRSP